MICRVNGQGNIWRLVVLGMLCTGASECGGEGIDLGKLEDGQITVQKIGSVSGVIRDGATQAPIAGASVRLSDKTAVSDQGGYFSVADINTGEHAISITAAGYHPYSNIVPVNAGANAVGPFLLSPDSCVQGCPATDGTECNAGQVRRCEIGEDGCLDWGAFTTCDSGECADTSFCQSTCENTCSFGETNCSEGLVSDCRQGTDGCWSWGEPSQCPSGACANDRCAPTTCNNSCSSGQTQCENDALSACTQDSDGCWVWSEPSTCSSGQCGNGESCACSDECETPTAPSCQDGVMRACMQASDGCMVDVQQACPSGECATPMVCGPGDTGGTLQIEHATYIGPSANECSLLGPEILGLFCEISDFHALSFGEVAPLTIRQEQLTLRNTATCATDGAADPCSVCSITVMSIAVTGDEFAIAPQDFPIEIPQYNPTCGASGETTITVNFEAPLAYQSFWGSLMFTSTAKNAALITLPMFATTSADSDLRLHAQLTWDNNQDDLDIQLVHVEGGNRLCSPDSACYFAEKQPQWFDIRPAGEGPNPSLDFDDTDGLGPENINIAQLAPGTYRVFVHTGDPEPLQESTSATVRVYLGGSLALEVQRDFENGGKVWAAAEVSYDGVGSPVIAAYPTDGIDTGAVANLDSCSSAWSFPE